METAGGSRASAHELVLRQLEAGLATGRFHLGGRLPAERALAEELGVSRSSAREALRVLEAMGVVRRGVGSGPEAGAVVTADPSAGITAALRLHSATRHLPIHDLVTTRVVLESWAVRVAAGRVADGKPTGEGDGGQPMFEGLARAEQLLDAMDDRDLTPHAFHQLDAELHVALTALAGNAVITTIMTALRSAIRDYVMAAVPNLADWGSTAQRLRFEHRLLLRAVQNGEPEQAAEIVARHIEDFYRSAQLPS